MKHYRIRIVEDAEPDLIDIYRYIANHDTPDKADYVVDQLESLCLKLAELPTRGHVPPELDHIGITAYREMHFKPYRVIYQISSQDIFIHCILDGRRDLQSLLEHRLLR